MPSVRVCTLVCSLCPTPLRSLHAVLCAYRSMRGKVIASRAVAAVTTLAARCDHVDSGQRRRLKGERRRTVRASDDGRTRSNIRRRRRRTDRSVPVRVRDANFRSADGPSRAKRAVPGRCPLVAVVTPPAAAAAAARLMCEAKDRSAHSLRSAALSTSATRSRVWTGGVVVRSSVGLATQKVAGSTPGRSTFR